MVAGDPVTAFAPDRALLHESAPPGSGPAAKALLGILVVGTGIVLIADGSGGPRGRGLCCSPARRPRARPRNAGPGTPDAPPVADRPAAVHGGGVLSANWLRRHIGFGRVADTACRGF